MNKIIYIFALIFLLSGCNEQPPETKDYGQVSLASSDKLPESKAKPAKEINKKFSPNCLTTSDQKEIDDFIVRLKIAISKNDSSYIDSVISATPVGDDLSNIELAKQYFNSDSIEEELKSELKSDERFSPPDSNGCSYYIIGRNFPELEYSVIFDLSKHDSKITISKISFIG